MSRTSRNLVLLLLVVSCLVGSAFATPTLVGSTTITGGEQISSGGVSDTGTVTATFNGISVSVAYGQYSTPAAVASALAATISQKCSFPVYAHAVGAVVNFYQKSTYTVSSATISSTSSNPSLFSSNSFAATTLGWNTSVSLASNLNPSTLGADVTLTATVNPVSATGLVSFYNGSSLLAETPVGSGIASFITGSLPAGSNSLTATYNGSTTYFSSTSPVLTQEVFSGQAPAPTFSPVPSTYANAQSVTINDSLSGATIYYTTNGTTPTTSSAVYSGPITVSATETIEAIAAEPTSGYSASTVASAAYTITNGPFVTNALPATSPATVGTSVTITGGNFGSTTQGGTSTVTFNGTTAAPTQWSATSITTLVPLGATTGNIVVTVNGVSSVGFPFIIQSSCGP